MRKAIYEGDRIPRFYGISYISYSKFFVTCYPIPLNWIIAGLRWAYIRLQHVPLEKRIFKLLQEERRSFYQSGHRDGYKEGFEEGRAFVVKVIEKEYEQMKHEDIDYGPHKEL